MKILVVSDIHYSESQFLWVDSQAADYDLVVIAGDLLDISAHQPPKEQIRRIKPILKSIASKTKLVVTSGNHDTISNENSKDKKAEWMQELIHDGILIDQQSVDMGTAKINVCAWWNTGEERDAMVKSLDKARPGSRTWWIWVHHAPPRGSRIAWTRKGDAGDPNLTRMIGHMHPHIVLCGHIHLAPFYPDGGWNERFGDTWVFNPGREPGGRPTHIMIDLAEGTATHVSSEVTEQIELEMQPGC